MTKSKFALDPAHTDPKRLKAERERARELKKTAWWAAKMASGICHYCGQKTMPSELTLDHVVPLARGGVTSKNNCVASCKACNLGKKLETPVDQLLSQIESERLKKEGSQDHE